MLGDVNQDESIDLSDVICSLQVVTQTEPKNTINTINIDADINNDRKIGLEEALHVLRKVAELQ